MVEVVGDPVIPSELILPVKNDPATAPTMSGAQYISGAVLCYVDKDGNTKFLTGT